MNYISSKCIKSTCVEKHGTVHNVLVTHCADFAGAKVNMLQRELM